MRQNLSPSSLKINATGPMVLLFERNDTTAAAILARLRTEGYDVRAARIPVEVFHTLQNDPVDLVVVDLANAAANRREFWVGMDSHRHARDFQIVTFRYDPTRITSNLEDGLRMARADIEITGPNEFETLIALIRSKLPDATPIPMWTDGPPANLSLPLPKQRQSLPPFEAPSVQNWAPLNIPASTEDLFSESSGDSSPFAQPLSENPFKRNPKSGGPPPIVSSMPPPPFSERRSTPKEPPPPSARSSQSQDLFAEAFAPKPKPKAPQRSQPAKQISIDDAWEPPAPKPKPGFAYRGYNGAAIAPDDPRMESQTTPIPVISSEDLRPRDHINDRALSSFLMDSAVVAPQKLDALRAIQQTLQSVGMEFSVTDLAMLFKFLTPDQLLAALLVSRDLVTADEIASLGRIKQELSAAGKDYDLAALLVMFDVLSEDQVELLKTELF